MSMEQQLSGNVVDKIIESRGRVPIRIKAAMYLHSCLRHYPQGPCSLLEHTMQELIYRLFRMYGVAFVSTTKREAPVKGANLYQHEFRTADNLPIYCHELCTGFPQDPISTTTLSICEMHADRGCGNCAYGASLDDGEVCEFCRNGETRRALDPVVGDISMRNFGWNNVVRAIGEDYAGVVEDLAKFHNKIITDEEFRLECDKLVQESIDSDSYKSYLGDAEEYLFMNLKVMIKGLPDEVSKLISDSLNEEDDDEDDFNYDDLDEEPA